MKKEGKGMKRKENKIDEEIMHGCRKRKRLERKK
jgi:hypothetical protein